LRVVGIDTSTFTGGIALIDNGQIVSEFNAYVTRRNSEGLMGVLDRMLKDLDWNTKDLEGIAVSVGPGSFTGTRIGVTMAKVLGYSLNIPISAVITLDAVAANVPFMKIPVCPLICARRNIVYNAVYNIDGSDIQRAAEYSVGKIDEVINNIKEKGYIYNSEDCKIMFLGDGAVRHKQFIQENLMEQAVIGPPWYLGPKPSVVAIMGQSKINAGDITDPRDLVPFYMGKSSAEGT
jgi:tRNA threonylcarbamoyladenosine biosynthesis protein TsaB